MSTRLIVCLSMRKIRAARAALFLLWLFPHAGPGCYLIVKGFERSEKLAQPLTIAAYIRLNCWVKNGYSSPPKAFMPLPELLFC